MSRSVCVAELREVDGLEVEDKTTWVCGGFRENTRHVEPASRRFSRGRKLPLANLRIDWPEVMDLGHGVEMGLIELLVMQIGILLLALLLSWMTYRMIRSVLREAAEDWRAILEQLGKVDRNDLR